jgi:hypothetical protein
LQAGGLQKTIFSHQLSHPKGAMGWLFLLTSAILFRKDDLVGKYVVILQQFSNQ